MEKRDRTTGQRVKARSASEDVIHDQQAATEELRASNRELERLLEEVLAMRPDLRSVAPDGVWDGTDLRSPPSDGAGSQLKREGEESIAKAAAVIRDSVRLRRRSQRIREALRRPLDGDGNGVLPQGLSKREQQVLGLIVEGKSSKEVAAELGISFKTAVTHRASIMSKLDVHEIASVVREAIRRGLV